MATCIKCLRNNVPVEEYLANDHYCNECNDSVELFPLASPPHFKLFTPQDVVKQSEDTDRLNESE